MTTISEEEREAIRVGFARLLSERCREADVRRTMASENGHDQGLWAAMSAMGIPALLVGPEHDGIGAGAVELEAVMEEAGAVLLAGPLMPSAVMGVALLDQADDAAAKARMLPAIASGSSIVTVALTGDDGTWTAESVTVTARADGGNWQLDGVASFVLSANIADRLLVIARTPEGIGCFDVPANHSSIAIQPMESWDRTLRLSRIVFTATPALPIAGIDAVAVESALDIARVALAGEQAGAARRIFEITVEYLKTRVQFGRPIGGFQALKHMAADLLVEIESATSAARAAAEAVAHDSPERAALVNLAAFACADAFGTVAATAIQMHGGIAFTWEHPAHLYLRRARAGAQLLGQSDMYRERYLKALEQMA